MSAVGKCTRKAHSNEFRSTMTHLDVSTFSIVYGDQRSNSVLSNIDNVKRDTESAP